MPPAIHDLHDLTICIFCRAVITYEDRPWHIEWHAKINARLHTLRETINQLVDKATDEQ